MAIQLTFGSPAAASQNPMFKTFTGADGRAIRIAARDADNRAFSLSGKTAYLHARIGDVWKIASRPMTADESNGTLECYPDAAEIGEAGDYDAMVMLVDASGRLDFSQQFTLRVEEPILPNGLSLSWSYIDITATRAANHNLTGATWVGMTPEIASAECWLRSWGIYPVYSNPDTYWYGANGQRVDEDEYVFDLFSTPRASFGINTAFEMILRNVVTAAGVRAAEFDPGIRIQAANFSQTEITTVRYTPDDIDGTVQSGPRALPELPEPDLPG